jgi:amidase
MARSAGDAAAILQAIAGVDPRDTTALADPVPDYLAQLGGGVSDLVIGVDWDFAAGEGVDAVVAQATRAAADTLQGLGARVREIRFPSVKNAWQAAGGAFAAEIAAAHAEHFPGNADRYGPRTRAAIEGGRAVDPVSVARAYIARDRFKGAVEALFQEVDLILTPGLGQVLPTWEKVIPMIDDLPLISSTLLKFTFPFNLARTPTISLPGGFTDDGLPIGVQLIGPHLGEPTLIRAGAAFQRVTAHHTRRPPID